MKEFCRRGHQNSLHLKTRPNGKKFCGACEKIMASARCKRWADKNRDKISKSNRTWHLKNRYGITQEQYDVMYKQQDGKCACCFERRYRLVIDHSHTSGKIRSLLCDNCNCTIGLLHEDKEMMIKIMNYLGQFCAI